MPIGTPTPYIAGGSAAVDQQARLRREMAARQQALANFVPGTGGLGPNTKSIVGATQAPVGSVILPDGSMSAVAPFHAEMDPDAGDVRVDAHAHPAGTFTQTAPGLGAGPLSPGNFGMGMGLPWLQQNGPDRGLYGTNAGSRQRRGDLQAGNMPGYLQNLMDRYVPPAMSPAAKGPLGAPSPVGSKWGTLPNFRAWQSPKIPPLLVKPPY